LGDCTDSAADAGLEHATKLAMKRGTEMDGLHLREYPCPPNIFAELGADLIRSGKSIRFIACGDSMLPSLRGGDTLICEPVGQSQVRVGDIVFYLTPDKQSIFHRVIRKRRQNNNLSFQVQADNSLKPDGWINEAQILGKISSIQRGSKNLDMRGLKAKLLNRWAALRTRTKLNRFNHLRALEQCFNQVIGR